MTNDIFVFSLLDSSYHYACENVHKQDQFVQSVLLIPHNLLIAHMKTSFLETDMECLQCN